MSGMYVFGQDVDTEHLVGRSSVSPEDTSNCMSMTALLTPGLWFPLVRGVRRAELVSSKQGWVVHSCHLDPGIS